MTTVNWIYMVEWHTRYLGDLRTFRYATESFYFPSSVPAAWGTPRYESITGATTYEDMFVPGRVSDIKVRSSMFDAGRTRGAPSIDSGEVVFNNLDGALDKLPAARCDGRMVRVFRINPDDFSDFDCIWYGQAAGYEVTEETITLRLRGFQYVLDRILMVNRYAGTNSGGNGLEGTADDLKDKPKPFVIGSVYNVPLPCVNIAKQIYQLDGQIGSLQTGATVDVFDSGAALTYSGSDYASLVALEATAPSSGQYSVFRGPGGAYVRLGAAPTGPVTANIVNPMDGYITGGAVIPLAGYSTGCEAQVLMCALLRWMQVNELNASGEAISIQGEQSLAQMVSLPTSQEAGLWFDADATYLQAFEVLGASVGGVLTFNSYQAANNVLRVGMAQLVAWSGETLTVEEYEELQTFAPGQVADPERGLPAPRVTVNYKRNYRPLTQTELAGTADAALMEEWRTASKVDAGYVLNEYPAATPISVQTALQEQTGAQSLADDVLYPLYDRANSLATVGVEMTKFDDFIFAASRSNPGATFGKATKVLVNHPRYGATALSCWLIEYSRSIANNTVELTLLAEEFFGASDPVQ